MKTPLLPALFLVLVGCGAPDPSDAPRVPARNPSADRIHYRIDSASGFFGGDAVANFNPSWIETLTTVLCTFESAGTLPGRSSFLGDPVHDTYMKTNAAPGVVSCPAAHATSTKDPDCTSEPLVFPKEFFDFDVHLSGWDDDAVVTFSARTPSRQTYCRFASVVEDGNERTWGIKGTATLRQFRGGQKFPVRFNGVNTVKKVQTTSNVQWDFTVVFEPLK